MRAGDFRLTSRAIMFSAHPVPVTTAMSGGAELSPAIGRVTIVIPAHNEEAAIGNVLEALRAGVPSTVREIIVVDDGSSDRTGEIARAAGARVLTQPSNRGYGAALKAGIRASSSDYVLTMDADGQHRVEDVIKLCNAVCRDVPADCVIGHRTKLMHSPLWRMPGKWFLTQLARLLTNREIRDLNSGLRVLRRDVIERYMHLCPSGFSFSTTSTFALASRGYRVEFVPILVERRVGTSTVSVATGFQTILLILRLASLFNPLRIFLPLALLFILGGAAWTIPYLLAGRGVTVLAMLSVLTGVLLFGLGLICDQVAQLRLERFE
ncbi:MAG TPA: glycosyltransferase family 2 protein [Polyangiaceae bacterium]|nr:glycosyltransferase family 2 protein [Polyangiaceae bacterium]